MADLYNSSILSWQKFWLKASVRDLQGLSVTLVLIWYWLLSSWRDRVSADKESVCL